VVDIKYSINEVVRFAIEIEKEGIVFYEKMAEKTDQKEVKELYISLGNEEKIHQVIFESLLQSLPANEETLGMENEYTAYLKSVIENTLFDKKSITEKAADLNSDSDVVDFAIGKEKESIEYYKNMKQLVAEKNHEDINKIIEEEKMHVLKLIDIKEKIS